MTFLNQQAKIEMVKKVLTCSPVKSMASKVGSDNFQVEVEIHLEPMMTSVVPLSK